MGVESLLIASTAMGAVGAISQGQAAAASARSQAQAAEYNAQAQTRNAEVRAREAGLREERLRRQTRRALGLQRAELAESGVGFEQLGTSLIEQSATMAELDALNVRYEGEQARRGLLADANLRRYEGRAARLEGRRARQGSYVNAASTVLMGGARYQGYRDRGAL